MLSEKEVSSMGAAMQDQYRRVTVPVLVFLLTLFWPGAGRAEVAIIPVNHRSATEMAAVVETMLSPEGRAVPDERTNSLIVNDAPAVIARIRAFLTQFDQPAPLVTVTVRFQDVRTTRSNSASVGGTISGDDWEVSAGERKRKGVSVGLSSQESRENRSGEFFVNVSSGSSAYIVVGKDIPFRERWLVLTRRYLVGYESVVFHRVETGMEVTPTVIGSQVRVEVTPRIAYVDNGDAQGVVRFARASTSLSMPLGQWVTISESSGQVNDVFQALLETGSESEDSALSIALRVESRE
jgi:hypothetical protein